MKELRSALLVSPFADDHQSLGEIFARENWMLYSADTFAAALAFLENHPVSVVITERDLPLGDWKDALGILQQTADPPLLVVTSRLADERLWAEVLNLGGHDVVSKPFRAAEIHWVLESAWLRSHPKQKRRRVAGPAMSASPP
jgi:DNA-binding response OmpR family regulator